MFCQAIDDYSYSLTAAPSDYTNDSLPQDVAVSIFFTKKISLTLIPFSSCGTNPIPSSGEVLFFSCATHIIEEYPLLPANFLFCQNMSRPEGAVISATLLSYIVLLKRRCNRSSHHINLSYPWQGLELCFGSPFQWSSGSCTLFFLNFPLEILGSDYSGGTQL